MSIDIYISENSCFFISRYILMSSDIILVNCKITTFKCYLLQKGRIALKIKHNF